jgi:hypothetical protein
MMTFKHQMKLCKQGKQALPTLRSTTHSSYHLAPVSREQTVHYAMLHPHGFLAGPTFIASHCSSCHLPCVPVRSPYSKQHKPCRER